MKWTVLLVAVSLLVSLASCGEEPPPTEAELVSAANAVVATYRDRIEAHHAVYLEIGRAAAAVPAADIPPIDLGSGPKLPRSRTHDDRQDIDLGFLKDHTIDPFRAPDFLSMGGTSWYDSPLLWLEGNWGESFHDRTTEHLTEFMTEWFDGFLAPRYLFVFRTHEFAVPGKVEDLENPEKTVFGEKIVGSYEAGSIAGDVLVFEVATKRFLGGVTFTGKNSGRVDVARFRTDPGYLRTDLYRNAWEQVDRALKPFLADR